MVLETHMEMCVTELGFQENFFLPPKFGKLKKNGPKRRFFEFVEDLDH